MRLRLSRGETTHAVRRARRGLLRRVDGLGLAHLAGLDQHVLILSAGLSLRDVANVACASKARAHQPSPPPPPSLTHTP